MERERMRIARNMHDEIGSKLTKISFLSERLKIGIRASRSAGRQSGFHCDHLARSAQSTGRNGVGRQSAQ